jgi:hypothetical protein
MAVAFVIVMLVAHGSSRRVLLASRAGDEASLVERSGSSSTSQIDTATIQGWRPSVLWHVHLFLSATGKFSCTLKQEVLAFLRT